MKVYHGGTSEISLPRILRTNLGRDFGPAFYTTNILEQAERWAKRRAFLAAKSGDAKAVPIVSVYDFDIEAAKKSLKCLFYGEISEQWLDMVMNCRQNPAFAHGYDVVEGKIANDSVGETVSYVVAGVMPKSLALERLKFQEVNNQIAFCSDNALKFLNFTGSFAVEEK